MPVIEPMSVLYGLPCAGTPLKFWKWKTAGIHGLKAHLPGAEVATVLWWTVSIALGFYLRTVPYSLIYGGLAVTIGLILWMQLTATILLIGAAYNAELLDGIE